MFEFVITTGNEAFWQLHRVCASTLERAIDLAVAESNDPRLLAEEARNAAANDEPAPGRYVYVRCRDENGEQVMDDDRECCTFIDAGGNG